MKSVFFRLLEVLHWICFLFPFLFLPAIGLAGRITYNQLWNQTDIVDLIIFSSLYWAPPIVTYIIRGEAFWLPWQHRADQSWSDEPKSRG